MRNSHKLPIESLRIAPAGLRTHGWGWRDRVKADDRIDIFDTQGNWFLGTVLDVVTRPESEGKVKDFFVGYRIYTSDGTKKDRHGRLHEGWSETYDEPIPAYSLRVQPYLLPFIPLAPIASPSSAPFIAAGFWTTRRPPRTIVRTC